MLSYANHSISEFVTDEYFLESCLYPTDASERFWADWAQSNPDRRSIFLEAQSIVQTLAAGKKNYALVRLPKEKVDALWRRINATIALENEEPADVQPRSERSSRSLWAWGIAAAVTLLVLVGTYDWLEDKPQKPLAATNFSEFVDLTTSTFLQIKNEHETAQTYTLSDSSQVTLAPGATLLYPTDFGATDRTVHLRGDAEFDIAHQPDRPFIVYADQLVARVLGTRFKVYRQSGQTEVSVISGKVSVSKRKNFDKNKMDNAVVLLPNQHAAYDTRKDDLLKSIVTAPVVLNQPDHVSELVFDDTPVSRVFSRLEKTYGLSIVYDDSVFRNCTLTATLNDMPFRVQMNLICETIHASYEVVDGQVVVSGLGCK